MVTARARALAMACVGGSGRPGRASVGDLLRCSAREGERKREASPRQRHFWLRLARTLASGRDGDSVRVSVSRKYLRRRFLKTFLNRSRVKVALGGTHRYRYHTYFPPLPGGDTHKLLWPPIVRMSEHEPGRGRLPCSARENTRLYTCDCGSPPFSFTRLTCTVSCGSFSRLNESHFLFRPTSTLTGCRSTVCTRSSTQAASSPRRGSATPSHAASTSSHCSRNPSQLRQQQSKWPSLGSNSARRARHSTPSLVHVASVSSANLCTANLTIMDTSGRVVRLRCADVP